MKKIIILLLLSVPILLTAQNSDKSKIKVDRKRDIIMIDDVDYLKFENKMAGLVAFYNLAGEKLYVLKSESYKDYNYVTKSNPEGKVSYYVIFFEGVDGKAETAYTTIAAMVKIFIKNDVLEGQTLNKKAAEDFIKIMGTSYSDKR